MEGFLVDDDRLCVNRFATVPLQGVCRVYGGYLLTRQISYCRHLPLESFGRIDSMTMPIVFAYRTGLCGVLPDKQGGKWHRLRGEDEALAWQQKHVAFFNNYVLEFTLVNDPQQHCSLVLVKPFLSIQ